MDFRCLQCNSKLSKIKELIIIKADKPIATIEIKCRKCKAINCYLIPSSFNKFKKK